MAGLSFGALAGIGAVHLHQTGSTKILLGSAPSLLSQHSSSKGPRGLSGTSVALSGIMGMRFAKSGKFMPAGLVCALRLPPQTPHGHGD